MIQQMFLADVIKLEGCAGDRVMARLRACNIGTHAETKHLKKLPTKPDISGRITTLETYPKVRYVNHLASITIFSSYPLLTNINIYVKHCSWARWQNTQNNVYEYPSPSTISYCTLYNINLINFSLYHEFNSSFEQDSDYFSDFAFYTEVSVTQTGFSSVQI